jgi:20S proteasome alpha/beta subunit
VSKGETSLGIKGKNCVVLASEKKMNSILMEEESINKI